MNDDPFHGGSAVPAGISNDERYKAYTLFKAKYEKQVQSRDKARSAALQNPQLLQQWPLTGRHYQEQIDSAMSDWLVKGFKDEIETLFARMKVQGQHSTDSEKGESPS
ncbi:hypothetical protein NMQ03_09500 [Arthrobacter sp. DNA4]|uniref:hypothetical protein n=1 Tax=Arthrobacter sp. DNA4 TaxID=2963432 RepID=UPI0020CEF570|nr:hypothetical protein [Arthrobacter sp. DNA4]UTT71288.1 hypothetical protein NMQ03_09500 [Arthrobacter sp. DNA4]